MEGVLMLMFLCITMLIGSFMSGLVPLALTLSETKMRHITIIGAGLLIGTALAVIIPEGIHTLYSNEKCTVEIKHDEHSSRVQKRSIDDISNEQFDREQLELFLNRLSANNNLNTKVLSKRSLTNKLSDRQLLDLFMARVGETINVNTVLKKRDLSIDNNEENKNSHLVNKREANEAEKGNKLSDVEKEHELLAKEQLKIKADLKRKESLDAHQGHARLDTEHEHSHNESNGNAHSAIGITLVLGFVFMLVIDQIGGKFSHRTHQVLDHTQAVRNKITFSTTLGLVVHAAADGIALGAAASTSKTDIEMIVFIAIMLHKAPAAFGLVSFLIHEGLERAKVRKHLIIFAMAAPVMAIITFIALNSSSKMNVVSSDSTGLCMLFSAGTFLYVSTVHVLPEVQSHNEDRQFRFGEMLSFIIGAMLPIFLTIGHSH